LEKEVFQMANKFKVGDKVRAILVDGRTPYAVTSPKANPPYIGTVLHVYDDWTIEVEDHNFPMGRGLGYTVESKYFELVEAAEPKAKRVELTEEIVTCDCCGAIIEDTEYLVFDGKKYCNDCEDREIGTCEHCGEMFLYDNMTEVNGEYYCDECLDELFVECRDCGRFIERGWGYSTYDGDCICEDCYDENYSTCECCGEIYPMEDMVWDDWEETYYCERCDARRQEVIHGYSYKPTPIFYGGNGDDSKMYMGVELEIDGGGERSDRAKTILDMANTDNTIVYGKHDGSINDGFEIVSHPATLEYHTNNIAWRELMDKAVELGYKSHETSTCGLHIHISRDALGEDYDEREDTISRIIYFVEKHWKKVLKFTRRSEERMNRWARRYGKKKTVEDTYDNAKGSYGRYYCINLENEHTVEFRMYRGTLKHSTFLATLQFTNLLCEFCKKATNKGMERLSWNAFCKKIDREKMPELIEYLKERRLFEIEEDN
jgi:hypothetical protein